MAWLLKERCVINTCSCLVCENILAAVIVLATDEPSALTGKERDPLVRFVCIQSVRLRPKHGTPTLKVRIPHGGGQLTFDILLNLQTVFEVGSSDGAITQRWARSKEAELQVNC